MSRDDPAGSDAAELPLATYGTLRRGERNAPLLAGATYLGTGRIAGRLHEMRSAATRPYGYPSCLSAGEGPPAIVVELYGVDPSTLAAIDVLEAFDPADEAGSEYVRRAVDVDGPVDRAWVYEYNGPPSEVGAVIPEGDWVAHRRGSRVDQRAGASTDEK
jgi:gamma-glutamylcyclotransferase (GGCT)/AIG2-like uncharacterized protein YtfP